MKRLPIVFLILSLSFLPELWGQDFIVTWENDTIACKLPGSGKEAGLRPVRKYENGYQKIVAIFANDSIRVLNAGEIKGYSRKKHGKKLLCDGYFEAKQIISLNQKKRTLVDEKMNRQEDKPWYFMNILVKGKHASLFSYYEYQGDSFNQFYYLHRHGIEEPNTVIPFFNRKKMVELLSEEGFATEMQGFKYRKSMKGVLEIVNEYNRLKEIAASKLQS